MPTQLIKSPFRRKKGGSGWRKHCSGDVGK
jgi:hypothetical protein